MKLFRRCIKKSFCCLQKRKVSKTSILRIKTEEISQKCNKKFALTIFYITGKNNVFF